MAEACVKIGCPEVIRLSLQDSCSGEPVPGAANGALIRCSRNATLEKLVADEEVSEFVADCGTSDRYVQDPRIDGFNVSFEVSSFSPETEALLTGSTIIANGGTNVGALYEAGVGCAEQASNPRFIAEMFFRRRGGCGDGVTVNYVRYVVGGLRFSPTELDAEGQIRLMRFSATSEPTLLSGYTGVNPGPFGDVPAGVVTSLEANDADTQYHGFWFGDPITDPTNGITLATNTCYTATVPAAS